MRWEERSSRECSDAYLRFVDDPLIGGKAALYMSGDRIRVWIKDGPAKEYRRALQGVGLYAEFTRRRASVPESVVAGVLGSDWSVVPGTVMEKPMRCVARHGDESRLIVWGPETALKELVWCVALHRAEVADDGRPVIALAKRGNAPIAQSVWHRAQRLADVIGSDVAQVALAMTWKPEDD
jgi:hypothetical protein